MRLLLAPALVLAPFIAVESAAAVSSAAVSAAAVSAAAVPSATVFSATGDESIPARADAESFEAIVHHVTPADTELAWRSIPWRPSLSAGMRDGAALDRPVLLWAMNGHPLGST